MGTSSEQLREVSRETPAPRRGFFPALPKTQPGDRMREFYVRMQQAANGLRPENLLAEWQTRVQAGFRVDLAALARGFPEPIAPAVAPELLEIELARLPEERRLTANGELSVLIVKAQECPNVLRELGRLREVTFRAVGEGTGKSEDIDPFDRYYEHMVLWNAEKRELAGAYRVGRTADILQAAGIGGLYTSTLFRYDPRLFQRLGSALELGRSFVRPEYQKQYAPLLLLWKGIGKLLASRPETPVLFGAVSISNEYCAESREMICEFFERRARHDDLAGMIEPRRPFRRPLLRRWDFRAMQRVLNEVEELSQSIADVERDGKGLPILLRQYAKIGGRLLAFNVDRKFSNVLDGLVVVDLRETEPAVLERYMGRAGAEKFRQFHGAVDRVQ